MHKTLLPFVLLFVSLTYLSAQDLIPGQELGHSFMYDAAAFELVTDPAVEEGTGDPVIINLPSPLGDSMNLPIFRSNLLAPALDATYPGIKTYIIGDPLGGDTYGRMVVSPRGIDLVLNTPNGFIAIGPDTVGQAMHTSYFTSFLPDFPEGDEELYPPGFTRAPTAPRNNIAFGSERLTYRLAIIADGEYSEQRAGPNPTESAVVAAIAAEISALNVIYERDLAIRFTLAETRVYLNSGTDIFPNAGNGAAGEAIVAFGDLIDQGSININDFDIGHVFSGRSGGSSAYVGATCRNFNIDVTGDGSGDGPLKAGGGSRTNGFQSSGWIGLIAHEMGHQFGGQHTFNGDSGNCAGGNYTPEAAYEIGSGSTIMSYGGICGDDNLAGGRDLYFHINSIELIYDYTRNGLGASCPSILSVGNNPPSVNANPNNASYTIPRGTPFQLSGTGSDPDGDPLTYVWEQYNLGNQGDPAAAATDTGGPGEDGAPLFRSFQPSPIPTRTFPILDEILGLTDLKGDVLPQVGREMDFRLTARDNNSGAGGVACDQITIQVAGNAGPFTVIEPDAMPVWQSGGTQSVAWNVANTNVPPVNCQNVRISLSTDGGQTFPFIVASSTPNDGLHSFTVPSINASQVRIKIEAINNIFFDISNTTVTISSSCLAEAGNLTGDLSVNAEEGDNALALNVMPNYGGVINSFSATINSGDPSVNLHVEDGGGCSAFGNNPRYETRSFRVSQNGSYTFNINRNFAAITNIHRGNFNPASPCGTLIGSSGVLGGGGVVNISNSVTVSLLANTDYLILFSGFNSNDAGNVSATVSGPSGSTVFSGVAPPGSSFTYRYAITNANGTILAFASQPDLSNDTNFPEGVYRVYGISVRNGETGVLNSYIGFNITDLNNGISMGAVCADVSGNFANVTITAAPLPIELASFTGRNVPDGVQLDWRTEIEIDNDYFLLERSADGRTFQAMAEVASRGDSQIPVDYGFMDREPLVGRSFYRLIQFDLDGTRTEVGIVSVIRERLADAITIYPNPIQDNRINMSWGNHSIHEAHLLDGTGRVLQKRVVDASQQQAVWDIPQLQPGIYMVRLMDVSGSSYSLRLVKN